MVAPEERFWTLGQMTPGATMPTTSTIADDPIDDVPDTTGAPRSMVDLEQFTTLFGWED